MTKMDSDLLTVSPSHKFSSAKKKGQYNFILIKSKLKHK